MQNYGFKDWSALRLVVINQVPKSEIGDVVFIKTCDHNGNISYNQFMIPYANVESPVQMHIARRQVLKKLLDKSLTPALETVIELFYFSYDLVLDCDYCFEIDYLENLTTLRILNFSGDIIYSNMFDFSFDERNLIFHEQNFNSLKRNPQDSEIWPDITGLYHMTSIENLDSILQYGLLSHFSAFNFKFNKKDISNSSVQDKRLLLHDYVPLYFNPRNPMMFSKKDDQNIIVLEIDKNILLNTNVKFTDGNAASKDTSFYSDLINLKKLNWDCINSDYWSKFEDGKRIKCSEVLVPKLVKVESIKKIHLRDANQLDLLKNKNIDHQVVVSKDLFFS
jgi:hypothetical protein